MNRHAISLTDDERALLEKIDLRSEHSSWDEGHAAFNKNKQPILDLIASLSARAAIPDVRIKYWNDSQYNGARLSVSRKGVFERNGTTGADIYTHPNFIKYLRYFLFGAELPEEVIAAFERDAQRPEWTTSGDILPLGELARRLVRQHGLEKHHAADEFFKLALDLGYGLSIAMSIRKAIK